MSAAGLKIAKKAFFLCKIYLKPISSLQLEPQKDKHYFRKLNLSIPMFKGHKRKI